MRYSVWDPHKRVYDYYEATGKLSGGMFAPTPRLPRGHKLGITPDEAAYPLPAGATLVGKGNLPVGLIASRNPRALSGIEPGNKMMTAAALLASAFLIWKYVLNAPPEKR